MQVERAVEHISEKVDELALRPEVFGTRLDEHVMQLMAQQKQLTSAVEALSGMVAQLRASGAVEPSSGEVEVRGKPVGAWQSVASDGPGLWAAVGAVAGALAVMAYVRAHRV